MKWTKETPTEPGLYAWKKSRRIRRIENVEYLRVGLDGWVDSEALYTGARPCEIQGVWFGPLPEPECE